MRQRIGFCDPGEDPIACEDCNQTFTLRIKSYTFKKDRWGTQQEWIEGFLKGKYELMASFRLFSRDDLGVLYKRDTHGENDVFKLMTIKRKEICREKGSYTSRGCNQTPRVYGPADFDLANGVISQQFRKKDEFVIIFYEDDSKQPSDPKRGTHYAYIHGTSYNYTQTSATCDWNDYPFGTATVPVERMNFVSRCMPMFENMDVPVFIDDDEVKRVIYTGNNTALSYCNLRDATANIKYSDFVNNEYTIDNDYVHIVLEIY